MDDPSQDWERVRFIKRSESLNEREREIERYREREVERDREREGDREREKTNGIEVERGSKR